MASLTAHQVATWLRDHAAVQEMHISALLQQEADGDVLDLLTEADLHSMTGDGLTAARIASALAKRQNAGTPAPGQKTSGTGVAPQTATIMHTTAHGEAAKLQPGTRVPVIRIARGWAQVRLDGNSGWVAETDVLIDAHAPTTETSAEASVDAPAEVQLHRCGCPASALQAWNR